MSSTAESQANESENKIYCFISWIRSIFSLLLFFHLYQVIILISALSLKLSQQLNSMQKTETRAKYK